MKPHLLIHLPIYLCAWHSALHPGHELCVDSCLGSKLGEFPTTREMNPPPLGLSEGGIFTAPNDWRDGASGMARARCSSNVIRNSSLPFGRFPLSRGLSSLWLTRWSWAIPKLPSVHLESQPSGGGLSLASLGHVPNYEPITMGMAQGNGTLWLVSSRSCGPQSEERYLTPLAKKAE